MNYLLHDIDIIRENMKIIYEKTSPKYRFPLSKKEISNIKNYIPLEIRMKIRRIEFGCNNRTTQEAAIVEMGDFYKIKINFCMTAGYESRLLSSIKRYIDGIIIFKGKINYKDKKITWLPDDVKRYIVFLIFHEIGHIIYVKTYLDGTFSSKSSSIEEKWCDNFSLDKLKQMGSIWG